jgi:hypothetical protein
MADEITIGDRHYYKQLGEWRLKAHAGSAYDTYTNECCSPLLDEIERLRKDKRELEMHIGKLVFEKYDL